MKHLQRLSLLLLLLACLPTWADAPLPATPAAAQRLLHVAQFEMEEPFPFTWHAEKMPVRQGTMLVIEVAPELILPRQTAEPVLYVGEHTAWRVSGYNEAGIVVAFVPAHVDLSVAPVWFGSPELPERVDGETAARELQTARSAGIAPFDGETLERVAARTDEMQVLAHRPQLLTTLPELSQRYIPAAASRR